MAKLAWFYGWGPQAVSDLDTYEAADYYQCITLIEAQQTLLALKVQDWPNMKQDNRAKWHRELHKKAYPSTHKKIVTTAELANLIRGQR